MLYFDHCASTPPYKEVIQAISEVMEQYYANPSSIHRLGAESERLLTKAREVIATALGIKAASIVFTSGGTESNNLAIKGIAMQYRGRGNHLITSRIEHASVYECFRQLELSGYRVTYIPVDRTGVVDVDEVQHGITDETILVSIMHVNSEVGRIQPIERIGQMLRKYPRTLFHVDAVQSIGKLSVEPSEWGIDLLSLSAHKIRGPKGIGLLYKREGIELQPLLAGGGQEFGWRSGTENVPLIIAMAKAIRITMDNRMKDEQHLYRLRRNLVEGIMNIPTIELNGSSDELEMAPHIVHFSIPGMKPEVVVHALEEYDIYVSTKSACASTDHRPSRVLTAMGLNLERATSGIRICLSAEHSIEDINTLCSKLEIVVDELNTIGGIVKQ